RGSCSRETGLAPLEYRAILSEKKYANAFDRIAKPKPIAMPFRPPKYCPTRTRNNVRTVSRNVVRRTLIWPQSLSLSDLYFIRFAPRQRVVSASHARTASSRFYHHDQRARDRPAEFSLRVSAARVDPESFAEWCAAEAALRRPGRILRSAKVLSQAV